MLAYNQESQIKALMVFFSKQPGMMLSIAYFLLTLSGIFYSSVFYSKFDIPILKLAEISDLLIAGISDPSAIVMFSGGIVVAVFSDWYYGFSAKQSYTWKAKPPSHMRTFMMVILYTPKTRISVVSGILFFFIAYSFVFVSLFAEWRSEQVKSGKGELVYIKTGTSKATDKAVFLLGSTNNFVITYDGISKTAILTPIDNIQQIVPVLTGLEKATKETINPPVPSKKIES